MDLNPQNLSSLIRGMLNVDAAERLSISQVKKHSCVIEHSYSPTLPHSFSPHSLTPSLTLSRWLRCDLPKSKGLPVMALDSYFGNSQEELTAMLRRLDHGTALTHQYNIENASCCFPLLPRIFFLFLFILVVLVDSLPLGISER